MLDHQIRPLNVFLHHLLEQLQRIDEHQYFSDPVDENEVLLNDHISRKKQNRYRVFVPRSQPIINSSHTRWIFRR